MFHELSLVSIRHLKYPKRFLLIRLPIYKPLCHKPLTSYDLEGDMSPEKIYTLLARQVRNSITHIKLNVGTRCLPIY